MSLLSGGIAITVCLLVVWLFPKPRYGQMRGCTGRALQAVMEQQKDKTGAQQDSAPSDKKNAAQ
jgi:hypothetical protein